MMFRRTFCLLIAALALMVFCGVAAAQTVPEAERTALYGPWHGQWTAPEGWIYEAIMTLHVADSGATAGEIKWTLRKSPRPAEAAKIGMTGVEMVRGRYYPESGTLRFDGFEKADPNGILGLDKYRLVVADNRRVIAGATGHHDRWTGRFFLTRQ